MPGQDPQQSQQGQNGQPGTAIPGQPPVMPQQGAAGGKSGLGKGPILAMVGCGLLILVLVLSLVGFFGVRALMGSGDEEQPTSSQEESPAEEGSTAPEETTDPEEETSEPVEGATTEPEETTEPTEEAAPVGEANAVPKGTVVTLEDPNDFAGSMDIVIGDVNWDATEWVSEQNSHNPQPTDQGKYIMVQAEMTYHGPDTFNSFAFGPIDYVAADGTPYEDAGVVTPDTTSKLALQDGESGTMHFVFMTPADLPEGGHFVVAGSLPLDEVLVEGQWVEAA
ncbi:MAG: hypothetical protein ACTMH5_00905 [Brachybacterium sp.]